jgi:serine/threonine protein kinase/WD40 repeat protein
MDSFLAAVNAFESAWRSNAPPEIDAVVDRLLVEIDGASRTEIQRQLLALVRIDLEYRWRRTSGSDESGRDALFVEEYARLIPGFLSPEEIQIALILHEYRCRLSGAYRPPVEEYIRRFPAHALALAEEIALITKEAERLGIVWPQLTGFEIKEELGKGSFGTVYKARQVYPSRWVAIKVLQDVSAEGLERFRREANAVAAAENNAHVIGVHQIWDHSKPYFLVLEYLSGGTLADRFGAASPSERRTRRFVGQAACVMREVASGLAVVHAAGVIHRDVSARNILFDASGAAHIADFGLAKMGEGIGGFEYAVVGTPKYRAPEQAQGKAILTPACDVYSFGVILFELLTKTFPYSDLSPADLHVDKAIAPPNPRKLNRSVDRDLAAICMKCLWIDPAKRFESAVPLAEDLKRYCERRPVRSRPVPPWVHLKYAVRRHPIVASLLMVLALVVGVSWSLIRSKETASRLAEQERQLHGYAADLQAIQRLWERKVTCKELDLVKDEDRMRDLLDRHYPGLNRQGSDIRGFEWYYWHNVLEGRYIVLQNGRPCRRIAVSPVARYLAASDYEYVSLWQLESVADRGNADERQFSIPRRPQPVLIGRWRIGTGSPLTIRSDDMGMLCDDSVAFSPDGKLMAAVGFNFRRQAGSTLAVRVGSLRVWSVPSGEQVFAVLDDPTLSGRAVTFGSDGKVVVAGCYDNHWRAWHVETKTEVTNRLAVINPALIAYRGESATELQEAAKMPDRSQELATSETPKRRIVRTLRLEDEQLYSSTFDGPQVQTLWTNRTGLGPTEKGKQRVYGATLPSDTNSDEIALDDGGLWYVHRWDESDTIQRHRRNTFGRQRIAFEAPTHFDCFDIRYGAVLAGGRDNRIYEWSLANIGDTVALREARQGHKQDITSVARDTGGAAISADAGGMIVIWSPGKTCTLALNAVGRCIRAEIDGASRELRILDSTDRIVAQLQIGDHEILAWSSASPNERFVAIALQSGVTQRPTRLLVIDLEVGRSVVSHDFQERVSELSGTFSGDSTRFAARTSRRGITVWDLPQGTEIFNVQEPGPLLFALDQVGKRLGVVAARRMSVWDVWNRRNICRIPTGKPLVREPGRTGFIEDGKKLVLYGAPVSVWDCESGARIALPSTEPNAMAKLVAPSSKRLYRLRDGTLDIMCGRTFRPLLSVPMATTDLTGVCLFSMRLTPGTDGFGESKTLDRFLDDTVARWPAFKGSE